MDLEEQTLHYYLKVFSFSLIIIFLVFFLYIVNIFSKNLSLNTNQISISKGERVEQIFRSNINNLSFLDIKIVKIYLIINKFINKKFIHYGEFKINNEASLLDLINIITKPSNLYDKITIVEGWTKKQLNAELSKYFQSFKSVPYNEIIADTYFIQKNTDFNTFINKLTKIKTNYFIEYRNNKIFNNFNENEIMIIGSLLEKEGLDIIDKKNISSVIFNRLDKKMKLQIDATVLFAITNGDYDLERKLLLTDLKIDHPYNTYINWGLPPKPISYVGRKTLDIIFEKKETEFLFYFFNKSLNKHIFSKTYKEHTDKLNEYRNK